MTKIKTKGTVLKMDILTVATAIVQVTNIEGPDAEVGTYDSTALDSGAGMETDVTGYVNGGTVTFDVFFDPVAVTHQALTDNITTPAVVGWDLVFANAGTTTWPFDAVLTKFTPSVDMSDGLKASCECKLDGIVAYPT